PRHVPPVPHIASDVRRGLRRRRNPIAPRNRTRRQKNGPPDRRLHGRAHTGEPAANLLAFFWPAFFRVDLSGGRGGSGRMVFTRRRRRGKTIDERTITAAAPSFGDLSAPAARIDGVE